MPLGEDLLLIRADANARLGTGHPMGKLFFSTERCSTTAP